MKSVKIAVLLLMICSPVYSQGQTLTATDTHLISNAKLIILSEWHLSDILPPYKRKLIEKLYKEEGLTDLILETGKSSAYLLNEYIATGDTAILNNFPLFTQRDKDYWAAFRRYKLPSGKPIQIHGIDFERINIVPALKRTLQKTGHTNNDLYRYLTALPDTVLSLYKYDSMKAERSAVIRKCIELYNADVSYYSAIYDKSYVVREICENTVLETAWDKRWDAMAHNLRLLYREGRQYLLIVGIYHVDCPVPVYKELEQIYQMKEKDIVNIALVVKDCEAEAMYQGKGKVALSSSQRILDQAWLVTMLYKFYTGPCVYQLVDVKSTFPNFNPGFKCDYILPVDCRLDAASCN